MAFYHVEVAVIAKGQSVGGAAGFAQYIAREDPETPSQRVRYRDQAHGHEDLVARGEGALPSWARDSQHFWQMADTHERGGNQRPGTVARTYQVTLPRELSPAARLELAADIRAAFFARYPHSWAVHNPVDSTGHDNPHLHLMMSERREADNVPRSPALWFSQAAGPRSDPAVHGVRKDRSWQGPERLREVRAGVATLINAALEREGHAVAVSHKSLKAQAVARAPSVYRSTSDKAQVLAEREVLRVFYHPWEQARNVVAWQAQKAREHITDISREAIVDHVRDRFWTRDLSPARAQERQQSFLRALDREYARAGRERSSLRAQTHERGRQHTDGHGLDLRDVSHQGAQVHLQNGWEQAR